MRWAVSVKGVLIDNGRVLLARNHRDEWELPGGRLEPGESLERALVREFAEETGLAIDVDELAHSWVFEVVPGRHVVVIAFACHAARATGTQLAVSDEHRELAFHPCDDLAGLALPDGYRIAIARATNVRS